MLVHKGSKVEFSDCGVLLAIDVLQVEFLSLMPFILQKDSSINLTNEPSSTRIRALIPEILPSIISRLGFGGSKGSFLSLVSDFNDSGDFVKGLSLKK